MPRKNIAKYLNPWMFGREKKRRKFEQVRERDGDDCWRCYHPMDFSEPRNKKKSATIEHKIPRCLGGTWELDNLVLCHVGCNRHMAANSPEQKERMRLKPR
jgi:5-methylcytosine-specific restriction endonuclease McrA